MPGQPPQIEFGALPVTTHVSTVETPEGTRVLVVTQRPSGVDGFVLSPEHARTLASQLEQAGRSAATGLLIAGNGHVPQPPDEAS